MHELLLPDNIHDLYKPLASVLSADNLAKLGFNQSEQKIILDSVAKVLPDNNLDSIHAVFSCLQEGVSVAFHAGVDAYGNLYPPICQIITLKKDANPASVEEFVHFVYPGKIDFEKPFHVDYSDSSGESHLPQRFKLKFYDYDYQRTVQEVWVRLEEPQPNGAGMSVWGTHF